MIGLESRTNGNIVHFFEETIKSLGCTKKKHNKTSVESVELGKALDLQTKV